MKKPITIAATLMAMKPMLEISAPVGLAWPETHLPKRPYVAPIPPRLEAV
jgi:hypothetical protein